MKTVYLSLGSNMGDKKKYLMQALELLKETEGISGLKTSSFYETDPVGYLEQDCFLNQVIELKTGLKPYELLNICQKIEADLKRERLMRWGPRTIDIDILYYEGEVSQEDSLILPHPRMTERAFVLVPLLELNPMLLVAGKRVDKWVEDLDITGVRKV